MSEINEPELLPCPFCGGDKLTYDIYGDENEYDQINCKQCGFWFSTYSDIEDTSLAIWNRRTPAAPQWTTEPPQEEGWYMVWYGKQYTDCMKIVIDKGIYDSYRLGTYEEPKYIGDSEYQFVSIEDYKIQYGVIGWCKIDFPPLLGK